MRNSRIFAALILATSLISLLSLNVSAAAKVTPLVVDCASLYYRPSSTQGAAIYSVIYPTVTSAGYYDFSITEHIDDNGNMVDLRSIGIVMYPDTESLTPEFDTGYIYTYNFEFRMPSSRLDIDPTDLSLSFGVCTAEMGEAISLTEVTYTYALSQAFYTYHATAVLYVDETFSLGNLSNTEDLYLYLDVTGAWTGNFSLRCLEQKVTKAIGEDAYYQASVDAIEDLNSKVDAMPSNEYNFVYNNMPDAEGEINKVKSDLDTLLEDFHLITNEFYDLLIGIDEDEPVIYMPKMNIPILNIDLSSSEYMGKYIDGNGFFRPLTMLNQMNPGFQVHIDVICTFLRIVLIVTFITVGLDNMARIEWWL